MGGTFLDLGMFVRGRMSVLKDILSNNRSMRIVKNKGITGLALKNGPSSKKSAEMPRD